MERNEISEHEVKLYRVLEKANAWMTSSALAKASGIAERTARAHASKLVQAGLVDVAEVFPAHRYRLAAKAGKRNAGYLLRLSRACEVFGI